MWSFGRGEVFEHQERGQRQVRRNETGHPAPRQARRSGLAQHAGKINAAWTVAC
jgi:hypothetical protein